MARRKLAAGIAAAVVLVGVLVFLSTRQDPYQLQVLVPSAEGIHPGSRVQVGGRQAGVVTGVGVEGDAAKITLELDEGYAPLHAGTSARIRWNSLVGRRTVNLDRGAAENPALPTGHLIRSSVERVELDDVLAALDAPTRKNVQRLVAQLDGVLAGNQKNLRQTLTEAGPFMDQLGRVLSEVGKDDPAIRGLVTQLRRVTGTLAHRDAELARTVSGLSRAVAAAAGRQEEISAALDELPSTLRTGTEFLDGVPAAVDEAVPLLEELRPATRQLPAVSRQLDPVLRDLRPVVAELRPTLAATDQLLAHTPGLLQQGSEALPDVESAVGSLQPAVSFLRPYAPEVIGFLTNWASLFSGKNAAGHFGRALVPASGSSFNSNPGILPPGMSQWKQPQPGQLVGQTWTDANGDGIR